MLSLVVHKINHPMKTTLLEQGTATVVTHSLPEQTPYTTLPLETFTDCPGKTAYMHSTQEIIYTIASKQA